MMHDHEIKKERAPSASNAVYDCAQQIVRNYEEDYGFVELLDRFENKEFLGTRSLVVGKTPNVLALGGGNIELDLIINPGTIVKCMSKPTERFHGHDLDRNIFKYLLYELRNPVMLIKGSQKNSLVAVTDLRDREGRPVIVTIALNRLNVHHLSNQITSAYGREHFEQYIKHQFEKGNVIAINKNKANRMSQSAGHNWPIEETLISFNHSIAYTLQNVKGFFGKNQNYFNGSNPHDKNELKNTVKNVAKRPSEEGFEQFKGSSFSDRLTNAQNASKCMKHTVASQPSTETKCEKTFV